MLLQALNEFYKRASKPNPLIEGSQALIQEAAFTQKIIRWVIPLKLNGTLEGNGLSENPKIEDGGRPFKTPRTGRAKKGREAEFLADGIDSIFGLNPDIDNPKNQDMLNKKHLDFWRQIENGFAETQSPLLNSVLQFKEIYLNQPTPEFLRWGSLKEDEKPCWLVKTSNGSEEKLKSDNFTFAVDGKFLFQDETICNFWREIYTQEIAE